MRKTTKSNKMTRLRKTQRGGFIPILGDIRQKYWEYSKFKIPSDKENNILSMFAKMRNMKELASELYLKKGEIREAIKKSKTIQIATLLVKKFFSNRHNENWFNKNFITPKQIQDYYDYHMIDLHRDMKKAEEEEKKFKSKLDDTETSKYADLNFKRRLQPKLTYTVREKEIKDNIDEIRERGVRDSKRYKRDYQIHFKRHVCDTIATYLKQLYIIITGSKKDFTERPTTDINHYYYSCDDISKFPAVEKNISEENRTLLSNILGQDAMKNFIQNYNDVKNANEKLRGLVSQALNTGDVNVNTGDMETGDMDRGDMKTGHMDTGHMDTGHMDTGHMDTGDVERGDVERGDVIVDTDDVIVDTDDVIVDTGHAREPERMGGGSRKKRRRRRNKSNKK